MRCSTCSGSHVSLVEDFVAATIFVPITTLYRYNMVLNQNNQTLWTGSFLKICLVNFFVFVNFHSLLPTFPFFVTYLGGDAVMIGLATALFSLASILSRPFVGWLVDSIGRARFWSGDWWA